MANLKNPLYELNNGIQMPAVGLGVFNSPPAETTAAVRSALRTGYRVIDTAAVYKNEEQVGEGIRTSGVDRKDIFVTTKVWMSDYGFDRTLHAFDRSLRKLGLDYLDLYLIHWPVPSAFDNTIASYEAAVKLLEQGRVRAIGVSNFGSKDLETLIDQVGHVPAVNQIELHPFFIQKDLQAVNKTHGILTQAWSPIGGVNQYGSKATKEGPRDLLSHSTLAHLAKKYGKTPAQVVLRWHLDQGLAPIPKSVRAERIAENFDIFGFSLEHDDIQAINALDTGERGGPDPAVVTLNTIPVTIED